MPIEAQVLNISFSKGLDKKTDPKQVLPGSLLTLENAVFTDGMEFIKRSGYVGLSQSVGGGNTISKGISLTNFTNTLELMDGLSFYTYSEDVAAQSGGLPWTQRGYKEAVEISDITVGINANTQIDNGSFINNNVAPKSAVHSSGIQLIVWWSSGLGANRNEFGLRYSYVDLTQGTTLSTGTINNQGTEYQDCRIFVSGNQFILLLQNGASIDVSSMPTNVIQSGVYNVNGQSHYAAGVLTLNSGSPPQKYYWDAVQANNNDIYVLYCNAAANTTISQLSSVGALIASATIQAGVFQCCPAIVTENIDGNLWCSFFDTSSNLNTAIYNQSLAQQGTTYIENLSGFTAAQLTSVAVTNQLLYLFFSTVDPYLTTTTPTTQVKVVGYLLNINTSTYTQVSQNSSWSIASKAFVSPTGLLSYVGLYTKSIQPTYFLLSVNQSFTLASSTYTVSGRIQPLAAPSTKQYINLDYVLTNPITSNTYLFANYNAVDTSVVGGQVTSLYNISESVLTYENKIRSVVLANNLNLTGGSQTTFDGVGLAETNFHIFPEAPQLTTTSTGTTHSYSYVLMYKWLDNYGNVVRSAPSLPTQITTTDAIGVSTTGIRYFGITLTEAYKYPNIVTTIYRTVDGGTTYFKVEDGTAQNASTQIVASDDTTDAMLVGNEQLYTNGGEVDNDAPPSTRLITSYVNRLIAVDSQNPYTWWYSKQVLNGFPVEFSDVLTQNIDQKGGPITAVATMDSYLVFFKEYNIFYVTGIGPSPDGNNNDFSYPQIITTDVGCINPDSVVLMPGGLMFQTHKGIFLLERSLAVSYVGAPVESYNNQTITSATLIPYTTQVRFTLASGLALVYDYFYSQWSVFTNINAIDSVVYMDGYVTLQANGLVAKETAGVYTDPDNIPISLKIQTGWFSFANLQGFERIRKLLILGEAESNTNLTIQMAYDFDSTITQTVTIPITAVAIPLQYRIFFTRQKCEALQLTIQDSPQSPYGEGLRLSAMGMEVGIKKGLNKMAAAKSYG